MTDSEIIKALECCAYSDGCEDCPCSKQCDGAQQIINAIDLINRQKAEIERYRGVIKILEQDVRQAKAEAIKEFAERC